MQLKFVGLLAALPMSMLVVVAVERTLLVENVSVFIVVEALQYMILNAVPLERPV